VRIWPFSSKVQHRNELKSKVEGSRSKRRAPCRAGTFVHGYTRTQFVHTAERGIFQMRNAEWRMRNFSNVECGLRNAESFGNVECGIFRMRSAEWGMRNPPSAEHPRGTRVWNAESTKCGMRNDECGIVRNAECGIIPMRNAEFGMRNYLQERTNVRGDEGTAVLHVSGAIREWAQAGFVAFGSWFRNGRIHIMRIGRGQIVDER